MKERLQKIARQLAAVAVGWRADALMVAGAGSMSYGAWLAWAPAGFLVGGVLLIVAGLLAARAGGAE